MEYDVTPKPEIITGIRRQNLPTWKTLSELIDNSLDAGAKTVRILTNDHHAMSVWDDGAGVSDPSVLFRLGDHAPHGRMPFRLGRFGIGAKEAFISLGEEVVVDSVAAGKRHRLAVDFRNFKRDGWKLCGPDPEDSPGVAPYTSIRMQSLLQRRPLDKNQLAQLRGKLGQIFMPCYRRGIRVFINGTPLSEPQFPTCEHRESHVVSVDGHEIRIDAGIVRAGIANPWRGLWYTYGHRTIIPESGLGLGNASCARIAGRVDLSDRWPLTKNKDDILLRDEIAAAVECALAALLRRVREQSLSLKTEKLRALLTASMQSGELNARGKRPGEKHVNEGTVVPIDSWRRHRRAKHTQPGDSMRRQRGQRWQVDFAAFENDALGRCDLNAFRIVLNTTHADVARAVDQENAPFLRLTCAVLVHSELSNVGLDGQRKLRLRAVDLDDYGKALGQLLSDFQMPGESTDVGSWGT